MFDVLLSITSIITMLTMATSIIASLLSITKATKLDTENRQRLIKIYAKMEQLRIQNKTLEISENMSDEEIKEIIEMKAILELEKNKNKNKRRKKSKRK